MKMEYIAKSKNQRIEHIRNNTATTQRRWTATQTMINWIIHNKINYKT